MMLQVSQSNGKNVTPLICAVMHGHASCIEILVRSGSGFKNSGLSIASIETLSSILAKPGTSIETRIDLIEKAIAADKIGVDYSFMNSSS